MQHPIENRIHQRRIVQIGMPMLWWQLAGDQGGTRAHSIIDHLQQTIAFTLIERRQPPIIE